MVVVVVVVVVLVLNINNTSVAILAQGLAWLSVCSVPGPRQASGPCSAASPHWVMRQAEVRSDHAVVVETEDVVCAAKTENRKQKQKTSSTATKWKR